MTEEEISNLLEKEFRVMIVKMILRSMKIERKYRLRRYKKSLTIT